MKRILIEVLTPPVLAPALVLVPIVYSNGVYLREGLAIFGFGFIFTLGLSIPYTVVMELAFGWGLRANSWASVAISTIVGLGCGAAFNLIFAVRMTLWLLGLGAVVGAVTGLMVFWCHPKSRPVSTN